MNDQRTIQFSLNQQQREILQAANLEGESLNLTAKRLLLSALGLNEQPIDNTKMFSLEEKLNRLTDSFDRFRHDYFVNEEILGKDYKLILQRLEELENLAKERGWFNSTSEALKFFAIDEKQIFQKNEEQPEIVIVPQQEAIEIAQEVVENDEKEQNVNENLDYQIGDTVFLKDGRNVKILTFFKDSIKVSTDTLIPFKISKDEILGVQQKIIVDEMPLSLNYLYGVFKITNNKKLEFWTGKKFTSDPEQMKIYKNPPTDKTMNAAKSKAVGEECGNNYCERILLKMMNFPHLWQGKDTVKIAQVWADKNLIKE